MRLATQNSLSLVVFILLFCNINDAWSRTVEKQKFLAVLTFNITSFTSWPEQTFNQSKESLNLCVFGNNVVQQSFEKIDNKVVHSKTIHIINLLKLRHLTRCQVLYLSGPDPNIIEPLLQEIKGLPILTVGESMGFLKSGGMVGLENINGKIQLTINLTMIKLSKLEVDSRLLNLAKIVNFPVLNP